MLWLLGPDSSGVERVLGKDEVAGSTPVPGSSEDCLNVFPNEGSMSSYSRKQATREVSQH